MNINEAFPPKESKHLKADDLQGRQISVVIADVAKDIVGSGDNAEEKPVLYFQGKTKGMVPNRTNADMLVALFGEETDDWHGQTVVLYATMVEFQGKRVPGLRIKPAPQKPPQKQGHGVVTSSVAQIREAGPMSQRPLGPDLDDEIPF